jgi:hypothetical protein
LFLARTKTRENNELLVIFTPEIVRPMPEGQPLPQLAFPSPAGIPGEGLKAARTPGTDVTGAAPEAKGERIPVEELLRRMKTETDMKLQQNTSLSTWPSSAMTTPGASTASPTGPVKQ